MRHHRGFTLIEVSIAMFVLGILALISFNRFTKSMAYADLEKASWNLFRELATLRSLALKNDAMVFAAFDGNTCRLYIDDNNNGVLDDDVFLRTHTVPSPVTFGIAESGPGEGPLGETYFDGSGIAGNWATAITVDHDAIGTVSEGALYLSTPKLKKRTFCIGINSTMQKIKMYKWDGSQWLAL